MKIKDNSTFYHNKLTNRMLKQTYQTISLPLKIKFYNQTILTRNFPTIFQKSLIVPLHKFDDAELCTCFRPISLTLSISKIIEKY